MAVLAVVVAVAGMLIMVPMAVGLDVVVPLYLHLLDVRLQA
jgi:hypothetical protein